MQKVLLSLGFAALTLGANAQVKIKDGSVTSSTVPNSNAILELESSNKGLLYPRVALVSTDNPAPLSQHVKGMVVYDTAASPAGTPAATAVSPGVYYNDGSQWVRLINSSSSTNTTFIYGTGTPQAAGASCSSTAQNTIYTDTGSASATLGQIWICDGTTWQNYNAPASTEWNIVGTSTDAGASKTAIIARAGSVVIGSNSQASVASTASGSTPAQRMAALTVMGGDADINNVIIGIGGGQVPNNTALGYSTLIFNTTGYGNTAVGFRALHGNTDGFQNTSVGDSTLIVNSSGQRNVALGWGALLNNTEGNSNTAIGFQTLLELNGAGNNLNTAVGYDAGYLQTAGSNNIVIGNKQNLASLTGSNQLNIGGAIFGTEMTGNETTPAGNIGINTTAPTATLSVNGTANNPSSSWGTFSDRRIKTDIKPFTDGINVITRLKPVTFRYTAKSGYSDQQTKHVGFIAQDVEEVAPYMVTKIDDSKGASGLSDKRELNVSALNQILVNAIQEQQKEIEQLKKEIEALKKK